MQIPETEITEAFLRIYFTLKHHGDQVLTRLIQDLQTAKSGKLLWSEDIVELNKQIADIACQERLLAQLKQQAVVDPDIFIWRCTSRLDYGRKYCLNSPTLDEEPLQQAILNAINSVMSDHSALAEQLRDTMEQELSPIPGENMSLGDIDRAIADLGRQFTALLSEAADAGNADGYTTRFQSISTAMAEFKRRKAIIQQLRQEQDQANHRMQMVTMALKSTSNKLTDWDDGTIYQLLEKVTVLSRERIRVTLRDGLEIEQAVEQPKRRKFA